jgi:hypothetical protein
MSDLNETGIFSTDFEKYPNIEFYENSLSESRFVLFGLTDRWKNRHGEDNSRYFYL